MARHQQTHIISMENCSYPQLNFCGIAMWNRYVANCYLPCTKLQKTAPDSLQLTLLSFTSDQRSSNWCDLYKVYTLMSIRKWGIDCDEVDNRMQHIGLLNGQQADKLWQNAIAQYQYDCMLQSLANRDNQERFDWLFSQDQSCLPGYNPKQAFNICQEALYGVIIYWNVC